MKSKPHPAPLSIRNALIASFLTATATLSLTPAANAASGKEGAVEVVNVAVQQTMNAVEDSAISETEAAAILESVNLERVAQFALANTWKDLITDQKSRYMRAFEIYAKAQLREHLSSLSNAEVNVSDVITRSEKDAIVITQIATEEDPSQKVSWRVINDGSWGIVDIQVQGVWFAIQQREQFQALLDRNNGDIDALISQLSDGSVG